MILCKMKKKCIIAIVSYLMLFILFHIYIFSGRFVEISIWCAADYGMGFNSLFHFEMQRKKMFSFIFCDSSFCHTKPVFLMDFKYNFTVDGCLSSFNAAILYFRCKLFSTLVFLLLFSLIIAKIFEKTK